MGSLNTYRKDGPDILYNCGADETQVAYIQEGDMGRGKGVDIVCISVCKP